MPNRLTLGSDPTTASQAASTAEIRALPGRAETAWPAALATQLAPGDRVLVPVAGPLTLLWAGIAADAGLTVDVLETPTEGALARHLGADRFGAIKAVLVVHGETDPVIVRRALDDSFHDAILCVDASTINASVAAAAHADIIIASPAAGLARLAPHAPTAAA